MSRQAAPMQKRVEPLAFARLASLLDGSTCKVRLRYLSVLPFDYLLEDRLNIHKLRCFQARRVLA